MRGGVPSPVANGSLPRHPLHLCSLRTSAGGAPRPLALHHPNPRRRRPDLCRRRVGHASTQHVHLVYTINKDAKTPYNTREAQPTTAGAAGAPSAGLVGEGCCCWFSEPACCSLLRRFFLRSSLDSLVLPSAPSSLLFRCAREVGQSPHSVRVVSCVCVVCACVRAVCVVLPCACVGASALCLVVRRPPRRARWHRRALVRLSRHPPRG